VSPLWLGAGFIAPERFHHYRWWRPLRPGRPWYYWTRREAPSQGSSTVDPDTLDPEVAPFVRTALGCGLLTLPSCAGHLVYDPHDLETLVDRVEEDGAGLRAGTLLLRDTESEALLRPLLPGWRAPDRRLTVEALLAASGRGGAGVVLPVGCSLNLGALCLPRRSAAWQEGRRVLIATRAATHAEVRDVWGALAHRLPRALG
jgi:hypothetical protein